MARHDPKSALSAAKVTASVRQSAGMVRVSDAGENWHRSEGEPK